MKYNMKYFNENAKKITNSSPTFVCGYEIDNHTIIVWDACSPYVSIRVDGKPIASRALRRNVIKIALKYMNENI